MTHVLCPGSFDPPTLGHLDVIGRVADLFESVTVAVVVNPTKRGLFAVPERLALLRDAISGWGNVAVDAFDGLLVDYCVAREISAIVKGIRSAADVDYEMQMARMNAHLSPVPTLLVPSAPAYAFVSSSLVKQVASLGGDITDLVPPGVARALAEKFGDLPHG